MTKGLAAVLKNTLPIEMSSARKVAIPRSLFLLSTGISVGVVLTTTVISVGHTDCHASTKSFAIPSIDKSSEITCSHDNDAHTCTCDLSRFPFPLDGVPAPVESSLRFAAANEAASDKVSLHSYHLMYGPFLAPYLEKNVVSVDDPFSAPRKNNVNTHGGEVFNRSDPFESQRAYWK